jgi:hypothetical protein
VAPDPVGYSRKGCAGRPRDMRPAVGVYARENGTPRESRIETRSIKVLADREIAVVRRQLVVTAPDGVLKKTRIEIKQSCRTEAPDKRVRQIVSKVEQEIAGGRVGGGEAKATSLAAYVPAIDVYDGDSICQAPRGKPLAQFAQLPTNGRGVVPRLEHVEPNHIEAGVTKSKGPVEEDPQMPPLRVHQGSRGSQADRIHCRVYIGGRRPPRLRPSQPRAESYASSSPLVNWRGKPDVRRSDRWQGPATLPPA